jgi:hypothetical protein
MRPVSPSSRRAGRERPVGWCWAWGGWGHRRGSVRVYQDDRCRGRAGLFRCKELFGTWMRCRPAERARARVVGLDALRNRLDQGPLAFQLDPSANNRRKLQLLLTLLHSPELAVLYRG